MNKIKYLTANELMEKAREKIVPIPSQMKAQEEIATLISMHLNRIKAIESGVSPEELPSYSAFILGSTGSGKSHITKNLAKVCSLNFQRVDTTSITQSGVKGKNLSSVFHDILQQNPSFFEEGGILLFDEADKMRFTASEEHNAYNQQSDFLCILENGQYNFSTDKTTQTVNLDKTLILFAGACAQITSLLEAKYRKKQTLGFTNEESIINSDDKIELLSKTTLQDLQDYGFMSELCGRLQRIIYIPDIDEEGYKSLILDSAKTSAINKYKNAFSTRGVNLCIKNDAVDLIAETAMKQKIGARSIESIITKALTDAHNMVDNNPEYNKVILCANDIDFKLKYYKGKRKYSDVREKVSEVNLDISLQSELSNKMQIEDFCFKLCEAANLKSKSQEELFYNFLHTTCYFLANAVCPSERNYANLVKLAEAAEKTSSNPDFISPFEIICNDYLVANSENLSVQDGFLPYYIAFKKLSNRTPVSGVLVNALYTANSLYIKQKEIA